LVRKYFYLKIAPLKALAAEIVSKFSSALGYLKIKVREMTGDMNLTKQEMKETHIIVSTPEKWDVVTRKNDELMTNLNLMIIDEIHLLNDERGTVLE
jgi:replicative superfamily II helicase